ncbi:MAG TPA: MlaD family protein [Opitutaceae bacterium]|nr:MlaD family protein [Opitutaceae bacterium]
MKTKVSPTIIGLFVIGAFVLGFVALISFGDVNFFSRPQRFVVYFNESIHGLDLGSPVKLRGVRVGRVVDLNVRYDAAQNQSMVAVACELSRNVITDRDGTNVDVSNRDVLQKLIDHGLRAQLGVVGLATGMLFVELDFYNPHEYPPDPKAPEAKYAIVPAVPSAISEYQASLTVILSDLRKVDFAGLSKELKGLLVDTRKQVNTIEVKGLLAEWTKAGQSVNALATSPEFKQAFVHLDAAVADLRGVLARLDAQIDPAGAKFGDTLAEAKRTLESFNESALTLRRFVNAQQNLGADADQAFTRLAAAADAVQRLADFLERNPTALISGRKPPQ